MAKRKLGEILLDAGLVSEEQIGAALAEQARTGARLGEVFVSLGFATEDEVSRALRSQIGAPDDFAPDPAALALVPRTMAISGKLFPFEVHDEEGTLLVLMANPDDLLARDQVELATKHFVQPVASSEEEIARLIGRWYSEVDSSPAAETKKPVRKRVGEILVAAGVVDARQLDIALAEQKRIGGQIGTILVDLGMASEEAISRALASQSGVEHTSLEEAQADPVALALVSQAVARRHVLAPLAVDNDEGTLTVAMANPGDIVAIDELEMSTGLFVETTRASERQIVRFLDRAYGGAKDTATKSSTFESLVGAAVAETEQGTETQTRGAVGALVNEVVSYGIRNDATDIHFEPDKKVVRVRYRVDGDLTQGPTLPVALLPSIVARIKILADLDIAITRTPQDGKIAFPFEARKIDLRVSTFPSVFGESVVVRVLDATKTQFTLQTLGLSPREVDVLVRASKRPNGLVLAVGPTGSGKTTTLYAMLRAVEASVRKVITLEDPVEYALSLVTQCQINEKAGVTFASGLRAILRHDPDIVLVGEMRDQETANMALRASLTGHLVLSTLHTNDAVRTISRLRDMGIDPYLISSCLAVVSAQRLIRLVCADCAEPHAASEAELALLDLGADEASELKRGAGCKRCNGTGTRGRRALYEVLEITPEIAALIARDAPPDELQARAEADGMDTFRANAKRLACAGVISLEEAAAVAMEG